MPAPRGNESLSRRRVEPLEVPDDRALARELVGTERCPPLLEHQAQVAALPATRPEGPRAPRVERAAEWRDHSVGHFALGEVGRHPVGRVRLGDRLEQRPRVGMARFGVDLGRRADLDYPPEVHDRDAVAKISCGRKIVGDVEIGEPKIALQVTHQLEHLCAHAHVEHRDGLVGYHELRPEDDRPGQNRALLLTTGEVARVLAQEPLHWHEANPLQDSETRRRTSSSPLAMWWILRGCPTASRIVIAGLSDACGSWKMSWSRLRSGRKCRSESPEIVSPLNAIDPPVTLTSESTARRKRRLPAPGLAD